MSRDEISAVSKRSVSLEDNKVSSIALFDNSKEIIIEHMEEEYRLRITGNGKLILTK